MTNPGSQNPPSALPWLPNAVRYWEPRRILYNLILLGIFAFWVIPKWGIFRSALTSANLLALLVLALLANVCYSAAYLIDAAGWHSAARTVWLKQRWVLFAAGTLLAILIESYWIADEILSPLVLGR